MSLSNNILSLVRNCADEKNIAMFKAGAKAGNATLLSLVDDIHEISKIAVKSEKGLGLAILCNFFPQTSKTIEDQSKRIDLLEMKLYPMHPKEKIIYEGNVDKIVKVDDETCGYAVTLNMRPKWSFVVPAPELNLDDDVPETIYAKFLEKETNSWSLVSKDDPVFVHSHVV